MRAFLCLLVMFILTLVTACGGTSNSRDTNTTNNSSTTSTISSSSITINTSSSSSAQSSASSRLLIQYGNADMQFGELRLPATTNNAPPPMVIIIHGGCWVSSFADYRFMDEFSEAITALGYATWNIEYRALGTGGEWPVIFQDVSDAVDYVEVLAQSYAIDSSKVAIIGHSAGGHLALWAASRSQIPSNSQLYNSNPLAIKGVISLAGIANVLGTNSCNTLANDVIGASITEFNNSLFSRLEETSPLAMLPTTTKTFLFSGSEDGIVPSTMGNEYFINAIAVGDDSSHMILQGLDHFDLIDPHNNNWALYKNALEDIFSN